MRALAAQADRRMAAAVIAGMHEFPHKLQLNKKDT